MNAVLMAGLTIAPAAAARVGQEGKPGIRLWSDATWAKVADANLVRPDRCAVIVYGGAERVCDYHAALREGCEPRDFNRARTARMAEKDSGTIRQNSR